MNRIATMSVIRGQGECEAIINGVVQKEIQRLQEINKRQLDDERQLLRMEINYLRSESDTIRASRNKMLRKSIRELEHRLNDKGLFARIIDSIQNAWGMTYGVVWSIASKIH